jgi:hypothetical protein
MHLCSCSNLYSFIINPLNAKLNPICHLLVLLEAHHILHVSRIRVNLLILLWCYNSGRVLAFSTIPFHLSRSCTCPVHFIIFIFFRSFLTSSSHQDLGLPIGLPANGFHLYIFFTALISGILFMCPNQTKPIFGL